MVKPGGNDQESAGESLTLGSAHRVDRLPGDEHGHDGGFAGPRCQFERQAHQFRIRFIVGVGQVFQKALTVFTAMWCDLGQPNDGLNGFNLAKKGPNAVEAMVPPVLEETGSFWGYSPLIWIGQSSPLIHLLPNPINNGSVVVLLLLCRKAFALVKHQ